MPAAGTISSLGNAVVVSDVGQLAFHPALTGTGSPDGIYAQDGGAFTQIASKTTRAGWYGTISNLERSCNPTIRGSLRFHGNVAGPLGGYSAVFRGAGAH